MLQRFGWGDILLVLLVGCSLGAPWLGLDRVGPPSLPPLGFEGALPGHPFGSGVDGRDLLLETTSALAVTLVLSVMALSGQIILAVALFGLGAALPPLGWMLGRVARVIERLSLPLLVLGAMLLLAVLDLPQDLVIRLVLLLSAMAVFGWPRLLIAAQIALKHQRTSAHVRAARESGLSPPSVFVQYLWPGCERAVARTAGVVLAANVLTDLVIGVLGHGVPPGLASLGTVLGQAFAEVTPATWWVLAVPGATASLLMLALSLFNHRRGAGP